jgi:hypothetical protein
MNIEYSISRPPPFGAGDQYDDKDAKSGYRQSPNKRNSQEDIQWKRAKAFRTAKI